MPHYRELSNSDSWNLPGCLDPVGAVLRRPRFPQDYWLPLLGWRSHNFPRVPKVSKCWAVGFFLTTPINSWYLNSHSWHSNSLCAHSQLFSYLPCTKETQRDRWEHTPTVYLTECHASVCLCGDLCLLFYYLLAYVCLPKGCSLTQWFLNLARIRTTWRAC